MRKVLLALLFILSGFLHSFAQEERHPWDSVLTDTFKNEPRLISIVAVGDIMLGTNYPDKSYLPPDDGRYLLDSVKPYLLDADITFGNLEGTYLDSGGTVKKCSNPKTCYAFRSPTHYLDYIKDAGFDVVSLANNHSGDFGPEGRLSTQQHLTRLNIKYAGLLECGAVTFEKDSIVYGFAAFAPNTGCMDIRDIERAVQVIKGLDTMCDIVIVSFHGGAEGSKYQNVGRGTEMFLGENRGNLRLFTHSLIDAGADVIFGHGPHVTRGLEVYHGRIIAYSLGNFATYGRFNLQGPNGLCPILKVNLTREGIFVSGQVIPVKQIGEGIPVIDPDRKVIEIIRTLSIQDFSDCPDIKDDGLILRGAGNTYR